MIPLFKVAMHDKIEDFIVPVLKSGYITQGAKVDELEEKLQKYFDYPYILTLNSATTGLTLAVKLLDLKPEDEVLTPALTCTATNWAILANGVKLKWLDADPETSNIDISDAMNKISPTTKAIMGVHWGGYPVDLD